MRLPCCSSKFLELSFWHNILQNCFFLNFQQLFKYVYLHRFYVKNRRFFHQNVTDEFKYMTKN